MIDILESIADAIDESLDCEVFLDWPERNGRDLGRYVVVSEGSRNIICGDNSGDTVVQISVRVAVFNPDISDLHEDIESIEAVFKNRNAGLTDYRRAWKTENGGWTAQLAFLVTVDRRGQCYRS